jgi:hypothetical protein
VEYDVPTSNSFQLEVKMFGVAVVGSPFSVVGFSNPNISEGSRIAVSVLASLGIAVLVAIIVLLLWRRNDEAVRAGSPVFMILMLCGGETDLCAAYALLVWLLISLSRVRRVVFELAVRFGACH